jgi:hypothetical protein
LAARTCGDQLSGSTPLPAKVSARRRESARGQTDDFRSWPGRPGSRNRQSPRLAPLFDTNRNSVSSVRAPSADNVASGQLDRGHGGRLEVRRHRGGRRLSVVKRMATIRPWQDAKSCEYRLRQFQGMSDRMHTTLASVHPSATGPSRSALDVFRPGIADLRDYVKREELLAPAGSVLARTGVTDTASRTLACLINWAGPLVVGARSPGQLYPPASTRRIR